MKDVAKLFKAVSDDTRLMMLGLLFKHGEQCVCAFEEGLGISQSKSSRHLRYLYHAGLVDDRRDGTWIYYRIKENPSAEVSLVFKTLKALLSGDRLKEADQRLRKWLSCCPTGSKKGK